MWNSRIGFKSGNFVGIGATWFTLSCGLVASGADLPATLLHSFTGATPGASGLTTSSDGTIYGVTYGGGPDNAGTVFRLNPDGTGYYLLRAFSGPDGSNPRVSVAVSSGIVYGVTYLGGSSNLGTLFSMDTNGNSFTVLRSFSGSDGANPWALTSPNGGVLYGATANGGSANAGVVFSVRSDGTSFSVLRNFSSSDDQGANPSPGLGLTSGRLYGTTYNGGNSNLGTLFALNTDGSSFQVLKHFGGVDGASPFARPIPVNNLLYGTTERGGTYGYGTVYQINTMVRAIRCCRTSTAPMELIQTPPSML